MARSSPAALSLDPMLLTALGLLVVQAGLRVGAARRRVERLGWGRRAALMTGLVLIALALVSPLATAASSYLLSAHLVQITLLMGFAPPLLLIGLPRGRPSRRERWRRLASGRVLTCIRAIAVHPGVAIVLVNGVLVGWHIPAVYDACLAHPTLYAVQLLSLLAVSMAFWWPIVRGAAEGRAGLSPLGKLGYILLATIPQTFVGLLFALARGPFYDGYATAPRLLGLSALTDQQLAGAGMAILSKLALFAAFSVVMWRLLDARGADGEPRDDHNGDSGGQDRDDAPPPVMPLAPAWLGLLDRVPMPEEPTPARRGRDVVIAGR